METPSKKNNNSIAVSKMAEAVLRYIHPLVYANTDNERLHQLRRLARTISKDLFLVVESITKEFNLSPADRVKIERIAYATSNLIHSVDLKKSKNARLLKISTLVLIIDADAHLGASLSEIAGRHGGSKQGMSLSRQRMINSCCYHSSPNY